MADIRIVPAQGAINVTGSANFKGDSASTVLFVSGSGNVGVGTSNPISKLHVAGAIKATAVTGNLLGTSTDTGRAISILNSGLAHGESYAMTLGQGNSSNNQAEVTYYLAATGSTSNRLSLGLYNSPYTLNVLGNERVGIGTTNPAEKLDTFGRIQVRPASNGAVGNNWYLIGSITDVSNYGVATGIEVENAGLNSYAMTFGTQTTYLTGITEKMRLTSDGNLGIGTTAPTKPLHVVGGVRFSSYGAGSITGTAARTLAVDSSGNVIEITNTSLAGSGTANRVAYWTDSNTLAADADFFFDGTNVGIGTTSPAYKLDVSGDIHTNSEVYLDNNAYLRFKRTSGGLSIQTLGIPSGTDDVRLLTTGDFNVLNGSLVNLMAVKNGGNIGIGTTSPTRKLHVLSADDTRGIIVEQTLASSYAEVHLKANREYRIGTGGSTSAAEAVNNWYVYDATAAAQRLVINSSGSVGIGTTNPQETLQVQTSIRVEGSTPAYNLYESTTQRGNLQWQTTTNYVGIRLFNLDNSNLMFGTNNTERMRIDVNGQVGIGSTAPAYKLDVAGTGRFTSNVYLDSDNYSVGGLYFDRGSSDFSTYVRANGYPAGGFANSAGTKYWLEIGGKGGVHVVLNTDGGSGSAENAYDHFTVWQGSNQGDRLFYVTNAGNVTATGNLTVNGKITAREFHTTFVSASIIYQSGSTQFGNSSDDIHVFTGNVGIGVTNPSAKLDIRGGSDGDAMISMGSNSVSGILNAPANMYINADSDNGDANGVIAFGFNRTGYTGGAETMRLLENGNVGIGITNPGSTLHVSGSNPKISIGRIEAGSNNSGVYDSDHVIVGVGGSISIGAERRGDYGLDATTATSTTFRSRVNIWSDNEDHVTFGGANTHIVTAWEDFKIWINNDSSDAGILHLYNKSGKTEFARLHGDGASWFNGGNVGIGTTGPRSKLHVAGAGNANGGNILIGDGGSGVNKWSFLVGAHYDQATGTGNGVGSAGIALIGSLATSTANEVYIGGPIYEVNPATAIIFHTHTSNLHALGGSEKMRITSAGNVGIGSASPASLLDVAGTWKLGDVSGGSFKSYTYGTQLDVSGLTSGGWARAHKISTSDSGGHVFFGVLGDTTTLTRAYWTIGDPATIDTTGYASSNGIILLKNGNVGIGNTSPSGKLHVTAGGGDGSAILRITGTASDSFNWASSTIYANLTAGETALHQIGKAESQYNSGHYGYRHVSDNSSSNMMTIGMFQADYLVNILGNGNVGIGTTAPESLLHLSQASAGGNGAFLFIDNPASSTLGNTAGIRFATNAGASFSGYGSFIEAVNTNAGNGAESLTFGTWNGASRGERMRILDNGNVGIGTTAPNAKLNIFGSVGDGSTTIQQDLLHVGGNELGGVGGYAGIRLAGTTGTSYGVYIRGVKTLSYGNYWNDALTFSVTRTNTETTIDEVMRITSAGSVGIGTTTPLTTLSVFKTTAFSTSSPQAGEDNIFLTSATAAGSGVFGASIGFSRNGFHDRRAAAIASVQGTADEDQIGLAFFTHPTTGGADAIAEAMRISYDGNVGIGISTPEAALQIAKTGTDDQLVLGSTATNRDIAMFMYSGTTKAEVLRFQSAFRLIIGNGSAITKQSFLTSGTEKMTIISDGNVGIGTTVPGEKLDVIGNIALSGIFKGTGTGENKNFASYDWHWLGRRYSGYVSDVRLKLYEYFYTTTAAVAEAYVNCYDMNSVNYMGENIWGDVHNYHSIFTTHIYVKRQFTVSSVVLNGDDPYALWIDGAYVTGADSCCTGVTYSYTFTQGWHRLDLIYSEAAGGHFISLGWNPKDYTDYIAAMTPFGPVNLFDTGDVTMRNNNVGIGNTSPEATLHVGRNLASDNTDYQIKLQRHGTAVAPGSWSDVPAIQIDDISGDGPSSVPSFGLLDVRTGRIADADTYSNNAHLIKVTNDNGVAFVVTGKRRVGIGSTTSPAYTLDVTGDIRATGDVIAYSDRRVKENIVTLENSLDLVTKLRGVEYNKIGEEDKKIGVIAQEVLEVLPQVVQQDQDGNYSVAYGNMAGLFIEAIKQQQTRIETLEDRISVLEQLLRQKL